MSDRKTSTTKIELVETHNLTLSINRLWEVSGTEQLGRALYHAALMSKPNHRMLAQKIREAFSLP